MDSNSPTIDEVLVPFFDDLTEHKTGRRLRRVFQVEARLREYLEAEGHRCLSSVSFELLTLEKTFEPRRAFTRCMRTEDLLYALRPFIEAPWLPEERVQASVQVSVVEKLALSMRAHDQLDLTQVAEEFARLEIALIQIKQSQRVEAASRR
ncbi:hypothetical protein SAMN04489806_0909 [Paramicrobacterium humi]|uniref:Uncharacterized protein n=1 Tax=Paramicrobacterium humi TaxID=640635 RepID=A0A1H4JX73_9MICO|nr:hypothetical protein [Microbacterium humi]SEB50890.1 hypothetical protein SAMN04489806_0909 [Microbacterium humi]